MDVISMVEEDVEEEGDCKERSNRSTCKRLFLVLQLDCRLISIYQYTNI